MKKINFSAVVALAMVSASCSNEEMPVEQTTAGLSTITVNLPATGLASRASFGDGLSADVVEYAIFDAETGAFVSTGGTVFCDFEEADEDGVAPIKMSTKVEFSLANGRSYKIAFFAYHDTYNGNGPIWDAKTATITYDYSKFVAQTEERDGDDWIISYAPNYNQFDYDTFVGVFETEGIVDGPVTGSVTLKRNVAQVNWGTSDIDDETVIAEDNYGENAQNLKTKVEFNGVYTQFNVLKNTVEGTPTTATFDFCARPTETFPGDRWSYSYLSVNYLLVPAEHTLVEAIITPNNGKADAKSTAITNLPVQANWATNVMGAFLTSSTVLDVTKNPQFQGGYNYPDTEDETEGEGDGE